MRRRLGFKICAYVLCFSFTLLSTGYSKLAFAASEKTFPIGEMISAGDVKFEARQNVWKGVENTHFPVFADVRIKTESGGTIIALSNNSRLEVDQKSIVSIDQKYQVHLWQGNVVVRIPASGETAIKIGKLVVTRAQVRQASTGGLAVAPRNEESIGSVSLQANGAVTVRSIRGQFVILNEERALVADVQSPQSLTIPSLTAQGNKALVVAQAPGEGTETTAIGSGGTAAAGTAAGGAAAVAGGGGQMAVLWGMLGMVGAAGLGVGVYQAEKSHGACD